MKSSRKQWGCKLELVKWNYERKIGYSQLYSTYEVPGENAGVIKCHFLLGNMSAFSSTMTAVSGFKFRKVN